MGFLSWFVLAVGMVMIWMAGMHVGIKIGLSILLGVTVLMVYFVITDSRSKKAAAEKRKEKKKREEKGTGEEVNDDELKTSVLDWLKLSDVACTNIEYVFADTVPSKGKGDGKHSPSSACRRRLNSGSQRPRITGFIAPLKTSLRPLGANFFASMEIHRQLPLRWPPSWNDSVSPP